MKKSILLAVTICTLQLAAFSQKPWIGFQAGLGLSKMVLKGGRETPASQLLPGFTTGLLMDLSVSKHISFQPGINFIQKGGISKVYPSNDELKTNLEYLEIPTNFIFYSKPNKLGFFAGVGFNLGFAIDGVKASEEDPYYGTYWDLTGALEFGNNNSDDLKTCEIGANLLAGYSFKSGLFFSATGNFGLNNLSNTNGSTIRNNYFALKAGWLIRRKA